MLFASLLSYRLHHTCECRNIKPKQLKWFGAVLKCDSNLAALLQRLRLGALDLAMCVWVALWHKARARWRHTHTAVLNDCVSCEEQSHDNVEQFRAFQPTQCCVFPFYLFIAVRTVCRYGFLFSPINFLNMKYRSHKFRFSVLSELIGAIALHKFDIDTRHVGADRKF